MEDAFAAWGGPVACLSSAECSAAMADGSAGRAAVCVPFSAAALEASGGSASLRAGNVSAVKYCVCETFLSGPACEAVDKVGAYSCCAALLVCAALYVRILWLSARSAREIAQTGKAGTGDPLNALRTVACVVAVLVSQICVQALMWTGAPLDRQSMLLAYGALNGLAVTLVVTLGLRICLMARKAIMRAEHRDDQRGERRLRVASRAFVSVSFILTAVFSALQSPLLGVTLVAVSFVLLVPVVVLMTRLRRLIEAARDLVGRKSDADYNMWRAVRRSRTMVRHTIVYFFVQVALRGVIAMTSNARVRAQHLPLAFAVSRAAFVLFFVAIAYLLEQVVWFVGGPAHDALELVRAGARRSAARTSGAASLPASSLHRQASGSKLTGSAFSSHASSLPTSTPPRPARQPPSGTATTPSSTTPSRVSGSKLTGCASSSHASVAPDINAASACAAASVRHGDSAVLNNTLTGEGSESSTALASTS